MRVLSIAALFLVSFGPAGGQTGSHLLSWPAAKTENRPWARWWWPGSAVDKVNLTALLKQYRAAGFGGLEICPIYGAKGFEDRYIDFLSPRWMEMLSHATTEARRLGMGIDLTDGTGWPFGGPFVSTEDSSSRLVLERFDAPGGPIHAKLPAGHIECVLAVSAAGRQVDLTNQASGGTVAWEPPPGAWKIYAAVSQTPIQRVKRAAPGGAGNVLDPFSPFALQRYLGRFDRSFAGFAAPMPLAHFHDSFEYYGASWTQGFLDAFRQRRGYDLRPRLPALFGDGDPDTVAQVKHDYRETLSDLHLAYVRHWTEWAHSRGGLSRNQAHGAPANLLDLYGAADIPETETFGPVDLRHMPMQMLASSAAHVSGKRLSSAEAFTWLGEHFQVSLADLKPAADYLFLAGINHLVYHGICYSPQDAPWPGWLFYAAVDFAPNAGLWRDLDAFNGYVTRCQSILQSGRPDNDVLLYLPIHDLWRNPAGLAQTLPIEGQWMRETPFNDVADQLLRRGYTFDWFSDSQLGGATVESGKVRLGGGRYSVIVVPAVRTMPLTTLRKLAGLANAGGQVCFWGELPGDLPGLRHHDRQRSELARLSSQIVRRSGTIQIGRGMGGLAALPIPREPMPESGLRFARRARPDGWDYFVVNPGNRPVEKWMALATPAKSAAVLDPRVDSVGEVAPARRHGSRTEFFLALNPGESVILRTIKSGRISGRPWLWARPAANPIPVSGEWKVEFREGGPARPRAYLTSVLGSWTLRDDPECRRFAGSARYAIDFDRPAARADEWHLDLGRVRESARVKINGREIATLWRPPYRVSIGKYLRPGRNRLEIDVANLAANRIADLDRRGVEWKRFHEINFVGRDYKPFDASKWPPRDSGLLDPVTLVPISRIHPP